MTPWKESSLGDACELYQPKTLSSAELVDDGEYLVYGANGVIGRYDQYNHEDAEILVTCRGATCGTVNISEPKSWINGNAMVVKPRNSELDFRFLQHLLRGGIDLSVAITGAAQPQITRQSLAPIKFKYPPLPEQRRIAAILDKADALRTKRRKALAQLDRLAQSIFVEMFGDPEEPTGKYPQTTLGELCRRVTDGTHQSPAWVSEGIPFLFISNIVNGKINFDTDKYISRETYEELTRRCPIEKGDVLYTTVGSYGNSAVVNGDEEFCFQRHIAHIKPDPAKLDSVFCAAMIESPGIRRQVDKVARGVAQKTVNLSDLKALKVLAPDLSVQRLFTQKIANLQRLKDQQLIGLARSIDLFSALQHRAFRGEL